MPLWHLQRFFVASLIQMTFLLNNHSIPNFLDLFQRIYYSAKHHESNQELKENEQGEIPGIIVVISSTVAASKIGLLENCLRVYEQKSPKRAKLYSHLYSAVTCLV